MFRADDRKIPSAGYKAPICTAADCFSVPPQLQNAFVPGIFNSYPIYYLFFLAEIS